MTKQMSALKRVLGVFIYTASFNSVIIRAIFAKYTVPTVSLPRKKLISTEVSTKIIKNSASLYNHIHQQTEFYPLGRQE
ncbi:MAG: hypothetical protein ACTTJ7_08440, partial [Treponema sp.]